MSEIFKCPACGSETEGDYDGNPICKKCNHICSWQTPETDDNSRRAKTHYLKFLATYASKPGIGIGCFHVSANGAYKNNNRIIDCPQCSFLIGFLEGRKDGEKHPKVKADPSEP
jgi:hypothetical protein